jgi:hypothetical protein
MLVLEVGTGGRQMESKKKDRKQEEQTVFYDELGPYLKKYFTEHDVRNALQLDRERFYQEMDKEIDDCP